VITKLFEPISIGPVSLANRVVMTAMHLNYALNGHVTDKFLEFYRARARGGTGLEDSWKIETPSAASNRLRAFL
jgi:2,4-dienoyl-CoA reductase-like NADH-dependent reductase (Old Yellow Enzyme family)